MCVNAICITLNVICVTTLYVCQFCMCITACISNLHMYHCMRTNAICVLMLYVYQRYMYYVNATCCYKKASRFIFTLRPVTHYISFGAEDGI